MKFNKNYQFKPVKSGQILAVSIAVGIAACMVTSCKKDNKPANDAATANIWLTTPDQSQLLTKQTPVNFSSSTPANSNVITVNENTVFQGIDGYGFLLDDASAIMIDSLSSSLQNSLLQELFSTGDNAIGISYIRLGIGATTMSNFNYTYDDIPSGTDNNMEKFSLAPSEKDLIPVLKKIIAINPKISIIAAPWSPPVWMKTNVNFTGGTLNSSAFQGLANYFVKYIQAMKAEGINITAITPQNEPTEGAEDPSMLLSATDEANFIANNLGPAFNTAGIKTKIICFDHNASTPEYPETVLANAAASPYIEGSAFHFYSGQITALSQVHNAFPNKNIYFTEQYTSATTHTFSDYLKSATSNLIIGATRNWARNVIEANLVSNINNGPHKADGCQDCLPAVTVSSTLKRNISYYLIGHASKFVRPGAFRIASDFAGDIENVAFKNADGSKVLIALNTGTATESFKVVWGNQSLIYSLPASSVATLKW